MSGSMVFHIDVNSAFLKWEAVYRVQSTNITKEIHDAACRLFDELWDGTPIRYLGVHTSRVSRNSNNR